MSEQHSPYYVPANSYWPIIGAIGLGCFGFGAASLFHPEYKSLGHLLFPLGILIIVIMIIGWFRTVIKESNAGLYSAQMDRSFRWGMFWFIFSEVMFFAAFFGALLYARLISVPGLGGASNHAATHLFLWHDFHAQWPLLQNPDPSKFPNPLAAMQAWGLPAINTIILLASGVTITLAHNALKNNQRKALIISIAATLLLGVTFLAMQALEYHEAYTHLKLTLASGIYGTTFYLLTGFHGLHVTIGTIMLATLLGRCLNGHFSPTQHFAFEAIAWYWHFVDVVWLLLFVVVYCI